MQITDLLTVRFIVTNNCMYCNYCIVCKETEKHNNSWGWSCDLPYGRASCYLASITFSFPVISILEFVLAMLGFLWVMSWLPQS